MMKNSKFERGQTLIEAIVALTIAVAIIAAIAIAVISSLSNSEFTRSQNQANQYASEALGFVRGIRDSSWSKFKTYSSIYYCFSGGAVDLSKRTGSDCGDNIGVFSREIDIEHDSSFCSNASRVTIIVSWNDNKCQNTSDLRCHKVRLISCLGNINQIPTP